MKWRNDSCVAGFIILSFLFAGYYHGKITEEDKPAFDGKRFWYGWLFSEVQCKDSCGSRCVETWLCSFDDRSRCDFVQEPISVFQLHIMWRSFSDGSWYVQQVYLKCCEDFISAVQQDWKSYRYESCDSTISKCLQQSHQFEDCLDHNLNVNCKVYTLSNFALTVHFKF